MGKNHLLYLYCTGGIEIKSTVLKKSRYTAKAIGIADGFCVIYVVLKGIPRSEYPERGMPVFLSFVFHRRIEPRRYSAVTIQCRLGKIRI